MKKLLFVVALLTTSIGFANEEISNEEQDVNICIQENMDLKEASFVEIVEFCGGVIGGEE